MSLKGREWHIEANCLVVQVRVFFQCSLLLLPLLHSVGCVDFLIRCGSGHFRSGHRALLSIKQYNGVYD